MKKKPFADKKPDLAKARCTSTSTFAEASLAAWTVESIKDRACWNLDVSLPRFGLACHWIEMTIPTKSNQFDKRNTLLVCRT